MTAKITPAQRARIKSDLALAEFDTETVTLMHTNLGAGRDKVGQSVESWLNSMTVIAASRVIHLLDEQIDRMDDEGEG